jgi:hypothetical protein
MYTPKYRFSLSYFCFAFAVPVCSELVAYCVVDRVITMCDFVPGISSGVALTVLILGVSSQMTIVRFSSAVPVCVVPIHVNSLRYMSSIDYS